MKKTKSDETCINKTVSSKSDGRRKQHEESLNENEEKYLAILEGMQEGYFEVDLAGNYTFFNNSLCRIHGYTKEELIGMNNRQYTETEVARKVYKAFHDVYKTGISLKEIDWQITRKDGTKRDLEASVSLRKDSSGKPIGFRGIVRDITERKEAENKLRESEANYRQLFDNSPAGIYQIDYQTGRVLKANDVFCEYAGCSQEEISSLSPYEYLTEESKKLFSERMEKISQGVKVPEIVEFEILNKKGKRFYLHLHIKNIYDAEGHVVGADVVAHDITERKRTEEILRRSEEKYRTIFENAIEGIYQSTIDGKFITANNALARMAGYDSPEELIESIKDIGTQLYVHPEDRKKFLEIKEAKGFVDGFEVEFYRKDGSKFWVVINALTVKDEQGNILYNEGLIEDISLRKQAEKKLEQSIEILKTEMNTTIHVLVSALESRDPYTAGHQSRSANLACAIATEMGLARDKIEGLRMAGTIHDIGKLSIPVEILSKPSKLTNLEFSLIKEHSHSGFEMLKDVESIWSLAEIVYQHHERMNGSGYPRHLKGDEILIEARILAVADVVEAMASHRPYRASLGIEAALEEIEKNKGILYDDAAAEACLILFREKGYQLT